MKIQICVAFHFLLLLSTSAEESVTRTMYDSMAQLVGEPSYPDLWWSERQTCFDSLSPDLSDTLEMAWAGMVKYWEVGGVRYDYWVPCNTARWFEFNCTNLPGLGMDIWEPCNTVSNLAYDRLVVELCNQQDWTLSGQAVKRIAEAFAIVTFGSSFLHGSQTNLGRMQDTRSNDLFAYILHQVGWVVAALLYRSIISPH